MSTDANHRYLTPPTPKQREEREEKVEGHVLMKLLHDVAKALGIPVDSTYGEFREALARLRTHSPEEPMGYVVAYDATKGPYVPIVCNVIFDKAVMAQRKAEQLNRDKATTRYRVHPIGQPLDGEKEV